MRISLNWLQRYVDLAGLSPERIADDLTMATAEVEGIEVFGESLAPVVVGSVVTCEQHPDADKLSLTQVDAGTGELIQVVCGANNVAAGQRIAFLAAGGRVPADGKKLKKSKIRGVESCGMILSERELGLSDEHSGILVLDTEAAPGTPLTEVLPLRDTLLEIDNKSITHRPDLWGHYGFARELAAIYDRPLRAVLEGLELRFPSDGKTVPIDVTPSAGLCPRYVGLVIDGVRIGPAPEWMRSLLLAIGQRPVNNVVDLTNWLLHDLGQPMHAFDLRRLRGPAISVRLARDGEEMRTLDGQLRRLTARDLLICDAEEPVALAGVMGGEGTMVELDTTTVFLESASFDAATIRRTSMRLGLRTDASAHFEKSLDPSWAELAVEKFAALLPQVVPGASLAGTVTDPSGWAFGGRRVALRRERASRILGVALGDAEVRSYLEPLGFVLHDGGDGVYDVDIPSWRATKDVEIEEDLIEELGRRHRYDNIEPQAPRSQVAALYRDEELELRQKLRLCLALDCGYEEALNYSFLTDELTDRLGLMDLEYVRVTNAIASHMTRVRRDVLPSLLGSVPLNLRNFDFVPLFEVGKGYRPDEDGERKLVGGAERSLPREVAQAVAVLADRRRGAAPAYPRVRGHLELLLDRVGRPELPVRKLAADEAERLPWMHPGRTVVFHDPEDAARPVAYVGDVHPAVRAGLELDLGTDGSMAALCIDVRALLAVPIRAPDYRPIPKFPDQPVDLAFLVPESVQVAELAALCRDANPKLVRGVRLFEVYRGPGLPAGKKSLNFTVTLGSDARTLTAHDEEKYIQRVRDVAAQRGFELRG